MKELYNTPELTLISFVPNEKLASFDLDDMENGNFNELPLPGEDTSRVNVETP